MQVWTTQLFRLFGERLVRVKLVNWVCWLVLLVLAWSAFARVLASRTAAWVTTALVACSVPLQRYCAIVQYEVLAGTLLMAIFCLNVRRAGPVAAALSGVLAAVLCIFRVHFVVLLPVLTVYYWTYPTDGQRRRFAALALGFVLLAAPWNAYYSRGHGKPFFFQGRVPTLIERGLHPRAAGHNYPWREPVPPSGLRFVVERPGAYLRLLASRATYLTGFERDIWWVAPRGARVLGTVLGPDGGRRVNAAAATLLVLLGAALLLPAQTRTPGGLLAVGIIAVLLAPHLLIGSSTRFLVPVIPLLTLLQVQGVLFVCARLASGIRGERFAAARG